MPGWLWLTAGLAALFLLARTARRAFRRGVRAEVRAYLTSRRPDLAVTGEAESALVLHSTATGEVTFNLHNLFFEISALRPDTPEGRQQVYRKMVDALEEGLDLQHPTLEKHGTRLLPRLVLPAFLESTESLTKVVRQELPGTGLFVVYVVDGNAGVVYLAQDHLQDLGLDAAALHQRSMENLRVKWDPRVLDEVRAGRVSLVKTGDTFDAARLLLLPEHLTPEESVLAVVPDRDTLGLFPANSDLAAVRKLGTSAAGPRLLDAPLRVTRAGFERV